MADYPRCDKCGCFHNPAVNCQEQRREPVLVEREVSHGSFLITATIAQGLKSHLDFKTMNSRQAEALQMICTKIARIVSGNALEPDHWKDIAGYAKLGEEACGK